MSEASRIFLVCTLS